jgi:hypothetical protein
MHRRALEVSLYSSIFFFNLDVRGSWVDARTGLFDIDIHVLIYLSTAIGLAPDGSTYLHAIHRTSLLTTKHYE